MVDRHLCESRAADCFRETWIGGGLIFSQRAGRVWTGYRQWRLFYNELQEYGADKHGRKWRRV